MQKITKTDRIVKDLSFLIELKQEQLVPEKMYKYLMVEGKGDVVGAIKIPCQIYLTFTRYDYEGRYLNHLINASIKHPDEKDLIIPKGVHQGLMTMKIGEKSWFNISKKYLPEGEGLEDNGCHYEVILNDIKYKNADNLQSKRMVNERNRQEAKELFEKEEYEEAIKKYRGIINITEGLEKGKFIEEEKKQIDEMNLKAKQNFLRCYIKLQKIDGLSTIAEAYSKLLLEKRNNNALSLFLRARVFYKQRYLDDALQYAIKVNQCNPSKENEDLILQIQKQIKK